MATPATPQKKLGIKDVPAKLARSFRDLRGEVKKVVWPSRKQVINNTGIVIAMVAVCAVFIGGLDLLLSFLTRLFFGA